MSICSSTEAPDEDSPQEGPCCRLDASMFSFQVGVALTGALHRVTLTGTDATSMTPRYLHTRINAGEPAAKLPTVEQASTLFSPTARSSLTTSRAAV